jgi:hypothetical protein
VLFEVLGQITIGLGAFLVAQIGLGERTGAVEERSIAHVRDRLIVVRDGLLMLAQRLIKLAALEVRVDVGLGLKGFSVLDESLIDAFSSSPDTW